MKILITGPCGSGKTTTLSELEKLGYKVTKEHAGKIWKTGLRGDEFELAVLKTRMEIYENAKGKIVFFDRSFLDSLIFRKFDGKLILKQFVDAIKKYKFDKVFVLEPLDNYEPDGIRELFIKNKEDAKRWFELAIRTCREYDYEPIVVKNMPIKDRIEFISKNL